LSVFLPDFEGDEWRIDDDAIEEIGETIGDLLGFVEIVFVVIWVVFAEFVI
jgi:hypothetical protein